MGRQLKHAPPCINDNDTIYKEIRAGPIENHCCSMTRCNNGASHTMSLDHRPSGRLRVPSAENPYTWIDG